MVTVAIKRVYDAAEPSDGYRVLVDRLWPRGVSKEKAAVDEWLKEVAPSTRLRQWFHHDSSRFIEFHRRYLAELDGNPAVDQLRSIIDSHPTVTLLYGARDAEQNQAVLLRDLLAES
jgi:DNA-3-methyladenine glycosylase